MCSIHIIWKHINAFSHRLRFGGQRIRVYLAVLALLLYVFTKISVILKTIPHSFRILITLLFMFMRSWRKTISRFIRHHCFVCWEKFLLRQISTQEPSLSPSPPVLKVNLCSPFYLVIKYLSGDGPIYVSILVLLAIACVFTIAGGLTAVIWTDFIQVGLEISLVSCEIFDHYDYNITWQYFHFPRQYLL